MKGGKRGKNLVCLYIENQFAHTFVTVFDSRREAFHDAEKFPENTTEY